MTLIYDEDNAHMPPLKYDNPPAGHYDPMPRAHDIHRRLNSENIDLRARLEAARKARAATWELLEAERQKNAALNDKLINAEGIKELRYALDTEKLLRVNDAGTIADLQRQLKEAVGQLKAQRLSPPLMGPAIGMMEIPAALWREKMAENAELRRTISLMAKTAAEVQDNFRLIAELASDPADEKRKEPKL